MCGARLTLKDHSLFLTFSGARERVDPDEGGREREEGTTSHFLLPLSLLKIRKKKGENQKKEGQKKVSWFLSSPLPIHRVRFFFKKIIITTDKGKKNPPLSHKLENREEMGCAKKIKVRVMRGGMTLESSFFFGLDWIELGTNDICFSVARC